MGELRQLNEQNKLAIWAERVTECRNSGQSVLAWCKEHGICSQTYYKWQKRLFTMAEAQYRHLIDEEKCKATEWRFGTITGKYVIYRGESCEVNGIHYLNVEEYLKGLA